LTIKIGTLELKNPVTLASGTAGYGEELSAYYDISRLGAIFTKGLSLEPRRGNSGNRILETPSGVLNSIGLENVGLEKFLKEKMPFLRKNNATVIPNIAGHSIDENVELCRILSQEEGVHAVELNVSCPNVKEGGIAFGTNIDVFSDLVSKVRNVTQCPLIVKLSPNVTDITIFGKAAEELGADAVSAVNTYLGMKINTKTGKPHFDNKIAGLSGPAIKPMAVRIIYQLYEAISIPIVGLGGIMTYDDMIEFIMAGAAVVSLGTLNMVHPTKAIDIINEWDENLSKGTIESIKSIQGCAHN
jgi:dihydroorotate dehydrogenase (NAD+) catalytic subunit